ncbi:GAF domain-containing protein [Myxococcus sp. AM011]|uniref:GAF domain-containing protein n=1 Tax=Myxococcus sp. AM011 TaxID=2745200 RepID=UPI001595E042|nr:GAF domain-containing protein [Myxococcus sp. AM011]NVJ19661.1 GAF domain-containing protein [Myxococcus sp. AM011]
MNHSDVLAEAAPSLDAPFLAGDGEMARRMREFDWASCPVGPVEEWPQSLRTAVSICLASRHPIEIWWGPEFARFYNDAYRPILGVHKHPQFLGRPGRECWGEIWDVIGPMLEGVRATGKATWSEDFPLMMTRNGYLEETYFTFSYAPLWNEDGSVGGIFCACAETTPRLLSERRLRLLRALGAQTAAAPTATVEEACAQSMRTLSTGQHDVSFALMYLLEPNETEVRLAATLGLEEGGPSSPARIELREGEVGLWPFAEVARTQRPVRVACSEPLGPWPGGGWPEPAREAMVHPLFRSGENSLQGFVVMGVSPRRLLDDAYRDFFDLAAGHIATTLSSAKVYEEARANTRHAQLGADIGAALTSLASLHEQLRRCCEALVTHVDAAFARIWVLDPPGGMLELQASAGLDTSLEGAHGGVPVGVLEIAQTREPHLTNDVLNDPRVGDPAWAAHEGMRSFAGHPLIVDGNLTGVLALFSKKALAPETMVVLASVANSIAVGIERKRVEDERTLLLAREQAALAEAERQRSRLESLFMQAPAGICVMRGRDHVFEFANPRYVQLIGDRDIAGKPVREALPELHEQIVPLLDRVYLTGEPFFGNELQVPVLRQGVVKDCFFNFIYQPIYDSSGTVEGIAVVAFEVTDQVRARQRAERLREELEITNQDLDQFAYVASHDLKAPLRGISSLSEWIEEGLADTMTEETRGQMRLLRGRVHRMEALINGILSYSRVSRIREKLETVDVRVLLMESRDLLAPPAEATIVVGAGMPTLQAERVPLQQVFMNLMSNALKHAGRTDSRIEVTCTDAGAFHDFTVKDNGPGIDPQFHDRIWGIFQTLEARDKVEGTGIGLSVVKKIVETRGGRVAVESTLGAGAAFHIYWPKRPRVFE